MPKLWVNKYQNYIHNSPVNDIESIKPIVHRTSFILCSWGKHCGFQLFWFQRIEQVFIILRNRTLERSFHWVNLWQYLVLELKRFNSVNLVKALALNVDCQDICKMGWDMKTWIRHKAERTANWGELNMRLGCGSFVPLWPDLCVKLLGMI